MPAAKAKKKVEGATTPAELQKMVNARFGADTVLMGNDARLEVVRMPTGILSIDLLTQGGFARNRHHELYGSANVGKTYVTYRFIAETQRNGGKCAFFDVEKTYDPKFAAKAGVNIKELAYIPQNSHGNKLIDIMETYLRSGLYDVIVLDSIAALLPKGELEKDMEAGSYGTEQAKMMSAALRRLTAANQTTCLVYINQTRESIGTVFAAATRTSGGRAMGFYAGMRIELVRTESIKRAGTTVNMEKGDDVSTQVVKGHRVVVKIRKNKTGGAAPEEQTTFVFDYDKQGIDPLEDLIYCGRYLRWIHKKGDYWWLDGYEKESKKNGRARFKKWLKDNPEVAAQLQEEIRTVEWETEDDGYEYADD